MKKIRYIIITLLLLMAVPAALTKAQAAEGDIDVNELVFGHIGDAYQWHIAKFGDTEVSIPLPVIVKSSTGWHVFSSARLEEGPYEGLYVAEGGAYDGKIVERGTHEELIAMKGRYYDIFTEQESLREEEIN